VLDLRGRYTVKEAKDAFRHGLDELPDAFATGVVVDISASEMVGERASPDIIRAAVGLGMMSDRISHRIAVVVSTALAYGLMRMGGAHAERVGLTVRVCHTRKDAIDWLLGEPGQGG
jgi:hypothetical protein